ncbi:hypothetical protein ACFQ08_20030, partial [Streptosporangium algeriense]
RCRGRPGRTAGGPVTSRRRTSTSTLLAGWLFADLLLGVTIIMLGAQSPAAEVRPASEAQASTAPRSTGQPENAGSRSDGSQSTEKPRTATDSRLTTGPQPTADSQATAEARTAGESQATTEPRDTAEPQSTGDPQPTEPQSTGKASPAATGTARPLRDTVKPLPTPSPAPDRPSPDATTKKPRSSRKPSPSPCVSRLGDVQAKPITISFQLSPGMGDEALAAQVRQELLRHRDQLAGRHAGMVLTFGADGGAGNGVRLATRVNTAIRETYPRIFGAAVTRNFHDLAAPPGSISMEIYLMTYGCSPVTGS